MTTRKNSHIGLYMMSSSEKTNFDMNKNPKEVAITLGKPGPIKDSNQPSESHLFCLDLSRLSNTVQFFICCAGIFFFYLIYGYFQELIFKLDGFKPFGWFLTLMQFGFYACFAVVERSLTSDGKRRIPISSYLLIALLTVGTMGLSNASVGYLNYPTQVIFKCCKLIPVMGMGVVIQGKKYNFIDVFACVCMSVGLIFFTLADSTVQPNFSFFGVALICSALCCDAVIGNVQEKTMKEYSGSNSEMVFYSYAIGFVYILIGEVATGELFTAVEFSMQYPVKTFGYAFVFSLTGYMGVNFVLYLVKHFGALLAVTVTTCRKAATIIMSFILFSKPFTNQYVWSGLIVLIGIYLNVYSKNKDSWNKALARLYNVYILRKPRISVGEEIFV